jgi:galactokinase
MPGSRTRDLFRKTFQAQPVHLTRAPGRLELLGNHTDYNEGLVMSLAVDRYIEIASMPRSDGKIHLVSEVFPEKEIFPGDTLEKNPAAPWADYIKGVLAQLLKLDARYGGFCAAVTGDIPMGAGMSSSAALEVAAALTVRALYPFGLNENGLAAPPIRDANGQLPPLLPKEKLCFAKLCQRAENQFVGVQSGLLDQISSLFGKAGQVMSIDFRFLTVEHSPLQGQTIVVCNSGVKHELIGGEYNELRENCESAARKLDATKLRSVELAQIKAARETLTKREYQCAFHVVSEIARVTAGERALREGDYHQFGQYMFQSHESSRDNLKNSTPKLDELVEIARQHKGCLGARLTGGGFGGATINLVAHHEAPAFMDYMSAEWKKRTGRKLDPLVCQIVDGAA